MCNPAGISTPYSTNTAGIYYVVDPGFCKQKVLTLSASLCTLLDMILMILMILMIDRWCACIHSFYVP